MFRSPIESSSPEGANEASGRSSSGHSSGGRAAMRGSSGLATRLRYRVTVDQPGAPLGPESRGERRGAGAPRWTAHPGGRRRPADPRPRGPAGGQRARDVRAVRARGSRRRGGGPGSRLGRRDRLDLVAEGARAVALEADAADEEGVVAMFAAAGEALGGLDGVVLNVGIAGGFGVEGTSVEDWDRVLAVNLRVALPRLQARPAGARGRRVDRARGLDRGRRVHTDPRLRGLEGRAREPHAVGRRGGSAADTREPAGARPDRHLARPARHPARAGARRGAHPARGARARPGRSPMGRSSCCPPRPPT